ncbi:MAG TPA: hypothetical protein VKT49_03625 [Bryobacteraceae bacterium]|nr:hypothetical protein [Bryobacteraceae bacterium]
MSGTWAKAALFTVVCVACSTGLENQAVRQGSSNREVPIYRVTIEEHGLNAVTYKYGARPTKIDFRGTVVLADGKGEATVTPERGHTEIDAKFENLLPPSRFGAGYLTYVLWAISPEGAARNLGEVIPNSSNRGRVRVTTDLSTFAMIMTAEPYAAVRQPSNVVVLENRLRQDTVGKVAAVQIDPELMARGAYTWQAQSQPAAPAAKVSSKQYEALMELYQAQNAVALARADHADQYAAAAFDTAQRALAEAQRLNATKRNENLVIENAREATQAAADARTIAERRQQRQGENANRATAPAPAGPQRGMNEANRLAPEQQLRASLHRRLDGSLLSQDTANGVVVVLPDNAFDGSNLLSSISEKLGPLASLLAQPGVQVQVDGYIDSAELQSWERAEAVRNRLVALGLTPNQISVRGGASAPAARDRRVQIVISF